MNTFDQALFYGFLLGVTACATLALGLYLSREEGRDTILPDDGADAPFRPVSDSALRTLTVCGNCHRYSGADRKVVHGQRVTTTFDLCPDCSASAHAARKANPELAQA